MATGQTQATRTRPGRDSGPGWRQLHDAQGGGRRQGRGRGAGQAGDTGKTYLVDGEDESCTGHPSPLPLLPPPIPRSWVPDQLLSLNQARTRPGCVSSGGLQRAGNHIRTLASTREELPRAGEPLGSASCLCFLPAASALPAGMGSPPRWSARPAAILGFSTCACSALRIPAPLHSEPTHTQRPPPQTHTQQRRSCPGPLVTQRMVALGAGRCLKTGLGPSPSVGGEVLASSGPGRGGVGATPQAPPTESGSRLSPFPAHTSVDPSHELPLLCWH